MGIESNSTTDVIATVSIYTDTNGGAPSAPDKDLDLLSSQPLLVKAGTTQELMLVNFDPPISIPIDSILVCEIAFPDMDGITGIWVGSNDAGETAPSYIRSDACDVPTFIEISVICNPCAIHLVNKVIGISKVSPCPWDLDGSGSVGTSDLLALFAQWGTAGPADFNSDGVVNTSDLLILFANWGPCP